MVFFLFSISHRSSTIPDFNVAATLVDETKLSSTVIEVVVSAEIT